MEVCFSVEKHRADESYRTNWKSTVGHLHSSRKLGVIVLWIVWEDNEAIAVRPKAGKYVPLAHVFSHVDLVE
jgi:hypothetical protein